MTKRQDFGTKSLHVRIPTKRHEMLHKLATDQGTSVTDIICQYLDYLAAIHFQKRKPLNATSKPEFKLDE